MKAIKVLLISIGALLAALFFENKPMGFRDLGRNVRFDCLVDVSENVIVHQLRDELMRLQTELACQLLNDNWRFDQDDFLLLRFPFGEGRQR